MRHLGVLTGSPARTSGLLAILAGLAACLAVNLPGHMSYDSVLQLAQGRAGVYNEWHPPVMAWLLGLGDAVVRGQGAFAVLESLLLYGALAGLVLARPATGWAAPWLALALAATPQWLIYPAIIWKDVLFAASAVAGFAVLALAEARWDRRRERLGLIALAFALLALAALTRQNGIMVLPAAAVALGWVGVLARPERRIRNAAVYGLAPLAGALALIGATGATLHTRYDGEPSRTYQLAYLQAYDLSGALQRRPDLELPEFQAHQPELARLLRAQAAPAYTPRQIDPIAALPQLKPALLDAPPQAVTRQWLELIARHPWLYLQVRATAFRWVVASPDPAGCLPVFTGVSGPEAAMTRLGMVNRMRPQDLALRSYALSLTRTPLYWHGAYALLAAVLMALLLRRRSPGDIAVAGMLAASLAFTASFFVVSVACDYRYLYFLDVAAMAAALYLAADPAGVLSRTARRSTATAA